MRVFIIALFLSVSLPVAAQDIEPFLRGIADKIIEDSRIAFINNETGEVIESTTDLAPQEGFSVGSPCAKWVYTSSMLCDGFYILGKALDDGKYSQFVLKNHQFLFDNMEFIEQSNANRKTRISELGRFGSFGGIWSTGPQGGNVLNSYLINKAPAYLEYVKQAAAHLAEIRTKEKTDPKTRMDRKGLDGTNWGRIQF